MKTVESNARYIASTIAAKMLDINAFDEGFIEDVPRDIISRITGKRFKKVYGNCPQKKLSAFKTALSMVNIDESLTVSFDHNLQLLIEKLELPETCKQVLKLCAVTTINEGLYAFFEEHLRHWVSDVDIVIAETLTLTVDELTCAIQLISNTSLFEQSDKSIFGLLLMPYALANNLMKQKATSYHDLLDGLYYQIPTTSLTLNDYPHIELSYVSEYLKYAVANKTVGVNILLYGSVGTGKTSLSQVLSRYAKASLIAVKAAGGNLYRYTDEINSEQNSGQLRLQHFRLMQKLFKPDKFSCLLIDEAEDIFSGFANGSRVSKDRLNSTLESNTLTAVWITNHIDCIPQSAIRRFSYVLNVDVPPKHIKAKVLAAPLKGLWLSQNYKNGLANIPDLAPAHVVNASNIAKALHLTSKNAEECIDHHIDQCLSACGLQTSVTSYKPEMDFDSRFINLSGSHTKIEHVIDTVTNFTGARCLLLGAAGTGKSALVHHIAETLEQELITIKPSDVLSKYVGEAEQNIANLFKQASNSDAIIFLDEVDSVLTSRDITSELHQKQLVNQILIELDRTEQTVFAATNYAQNLDNALLRRFDFKLNFEYLTTKQVHTLYEENFGKCSTTIKNKLTELKLLTPGDFAITSRRNRMNKKPLSDSKNLDILTQENNRKLPRKAIGFVN
ncbi:AAA family ATPase [Colwellia sp. RSH04]|uniref:AAA family ATPase n=1 Tax=Colwellia sp. RSH04 TaxID=2305464 RepID=UPI000E5794C8|nr:AAA family ATPase [Colwellia sp. RSH04]RHW77585.1 AAA family ATPase [Colwellia sp. RSH04]